MKKNTIFFALALSCMLVACTKAQETKSSVNEDSSTKTITLSAFTDDASTKAATKVIDNYTSGAETYVWNWEEGDAIGVWDSYNEAFIKLTVSEGAGTARAKFTGEVPGNWDPNTSFVVYPYDGADYYQGTLKYGWSRWGLNDDGRSLPLYGTISKTSDSNYSTHFTHMAAIVKVTFTNVPDPSETGYVWFETYQDTKFFADNFQINMSANPPVVETESLNDFIRCNTLPSHKAGDTVVMYVPVVPGTYNSTNTAGREDIMSFVVTVKKSESLGGDNLKKVVTKVQEPLTDFTFERGGLYVLQAIDMSAE